MGTKVEIHNLTLHIRDEDVLVVENKSKPDEKWTFDDRANHEQPHTLVIWEKGDIFTGQRLRESGNIFSGSPITPLPEGMTRVVFEGKMDKG